MELNLSDLQPKESTFKLTGKPGVELVLRKFSLRVQIWAGETYGADNIKVILEKQNMKSISEMCFFLLKDKSMFKDIEDFQDSIENLTDRTTIFKALLETVGISQPILQQIAEDYDVEQKKRLTGLKSSTESQASTQDTPT